MVLAVSSQGPRPELQPRPAHYEPTPEQLREEALRSRRLALKRDIHDLFHPLVLEDKDTTYDGKLTTREGAGSVVERLGTLPALGNKLHPSFVEWMGSHLVLARQETKRRRAIGLALGRLAREHEDLHYIVVLHIRDHRSIRQLARHWGCDREALGKSYWAGLDFLLAYLDEDGAPD